MSSEFSLSQPKLRQVGLLLDTPKESKHVIDLGPPVTVEVAVQYFLTNAINLTCRNGDPPKHYILRSAHHAQQPHSRSASGTPALGLISIALSHVWLPYRHRTLLLQEDSTECLQPPSYLRRKEMGRECSVHTLC